MPGKVVAAVEDLLFRSKISATADKLGVEVSFPRSGGKLLESLRESPPDLLIIDLASSRYEPVRLLREVKSGEATQKIRTIGFVPHVETDLIRAAREAGCDRIFSRGAFTEELPAILSGEDGC
ncbi:hypothetical protein [Rubrobacter calidifluminis]|uniref:hypothetical protein n=1 Tax=Rubrobacter calidifluminis TaxID=1392640 RepID=UPI00235E3CDB|nr:hypothetical protein [Rubrobacter calidifluminis]